MVLVRLGLAIRIRVEPDPFPTLEYTSKISKTILIKMNKTLRTLFARRQTGPPKPLAITPPLNPATGQPIAPIIVSHRKPDPRSFKPAILTSGTIHIHLTLPNTALRYLPPEGTTAQAKYRGATIRAELEKIWVINQYPTTQPATPTIKTLTPYIPKDPYTHSKYSPFHLAPDTTLSIPAYIHARLIGRRKSLIKTLTTLRKCLILPHTGYCRMRKAWYLTKTRTGQLKPAPALIGELEYKINTYECRDNELTNTIEIIKLSKTTGIGKSRANGLGILQP